MSNPLNHQHLILGATDVQWAPQHPAVLNDWLRELVALVNMEVFGGPESKYCADPGNEGLSGYIWLTTSHSHFHCWNATPTRPAYLRFDLYSCKAYDARVVVEHLRQFGPRTVDLLLLDRNGPARVVYSDYFRYE